MNQYFSSIGWRSECPRRVFARIDYYEVLRSEDGAAIVIGLDAIDADWDGFKSGFFNLATAPIRTSEIAVYWQARFRGERSEVQELFDQIPLYHLEITINDNRAGEVLFEEGREGRWFEFGLGSNGDLAVDVFGGLFFEPTSAYLEPLPTHYMLTIALNALFDMQMWPDSTDDELILALDRRCDIQQLAVLDVGQGSANALICRCGFPSYYFDVGCGVYRNATTRPHPIQFCLCNRPPIMLSHWDSDHWAAALVDRELLKSTWVAPRQSISVKHIAFVNEILAEGGKILIVPRTTSILSWGGRQEFVLKRCTGPSNDRNRSGLALTVEDKYLGVVGC